MLKDNRQTHRAFERFLSTFQTHRIQNIFLVDKPEVTLGVFRVLLDGGVEKHDKFHLQKCLKRSMKIGEKVWISQDSMVIYQADRIGSL